MCPALFTYFSPKALITLQFGDQSCPTLCNPVNHSMPGLPVHHQLLESTQTDVHWVSDAIQPSHPLLSPSHPALNLSQHQGLFTWVSSSHQVAKLLEFHFNISPSNEHQGLISFRIDWLYLLAVQGTLKSLLQHHSSKASILLRSAFFIVQFSHPNWRTKDWGGSQRWCHSVSHYVINHLKFSGLHQQYIILLILSSHKQFLYSL